MKRVFLSAVAILSIAHSAEAQDCNPVNILQQNTITTTLTDETALVYAKQTAQASSSNSSLRGSVGLAIQGVPVKVGLDTARTVASSVQSKTNIDYSHNVYKFYLNQYLSDNAVQAYEACLGTQVVVIRVSTSAPKDDTFFVKVKWNGGPFSPAGATLKLESTNGNLGDGPTPGLSITQTVTPDSEVMFRVSGRDVARNTELAATITGEGGQSVAQQITIPAYIPYVLQTSTKSKAGVQRGPRYNRKASSTCIQKTDNDSLLISETTVWANLRYTRGTEFTIDEGGTTEQVCGTLGARGSDFGEASIAGDLTVTELKIVVLPPLAGGSSSSSSSSRSFEFIRAR